MARTKINSNPLGVVAQPTTTSSNDAAVAENAAPRNARTGKASKKVKFVQPLGVTTVETWPPLSEAEVFDSFNNYDLSKPSNQRKLRGAYNAVRNEHARIQSICWGYEQMLRELDDHGLGLKALVDLQEGRAGYAELKAEREILHDDLVLCKTENARLQAILDTRIHVRDLIAMTDWMKKQMKEGPRQKGEGDLGGNGSGGWFTANQIIEMQRGWEKYISTIDDAEIDAYNHSIRIWNTHPDDFDKCQVSK